MKKKYIIIGIAVVAGIILLSYNTSKANSILLPVDKYDLKNKDGEYKALQYSINWISQWEQNSVDDKNNPTPIKNDFAKFNGDSLWDHMIDKSPEDFQYIKNLVWEQAVRYYNGTGVTKYSQNDMDWSLTAKTWLGLHPLWYPDIDINNDQERMFKSHYIFFLRNASAKASMNSIKIFKTITGLA